MSNSKSLSDLLNLFENTVTPEEVIASKLDAQISSAITSYRLANRLNQKQLASLIGVQQSLISRWESGNCNYNIKTLAKIVTKLNLDCDIILRNPGNEKGKVTSITSYKNNKNTKSYSNKGYSTSRLYSITIKEG